MPKVTVSKRTEAKKRRRTRRTKEQILGLILEAAGEEFELNGYEGAKTAVIAEKAGVAEALIFSNFGSKAKLFQDAIFEPLQQHLLRFQTEHRVAVGDRDGLRAGTQQYILELQAFISRHSRMLKSIIGAQMYANEGLQELRHVEGLHDFFLRASGPGASLSFENPRIAPQLLTRVSFATILACVIFKDLLFPKGLASQMEIGLAISDFVMDGVNANLMAPLAPPRPRRASAKRARAADGKLSDLPSGTQ